MIAIIDELGIDIQITEDECDFIDAIYVPSKYPVENVYADSDANADLCEKAIGIAEGVIDSVKQYLG